MRCAPNSTGTKVVFDFFTENYLIYNNYTKHLYHLYHLSRNCALGILEVSETVKTVYWDVLKLRCSRLKD